MEKHHRYQAKLVYGPYRLHTDSWDTLGVDIYWCLIYVCLLICFGPSWMCRCYTIIVPDPYGAWYWHCKPSSWIIISFVVFCQFCNPTILVEVSASMRMFLWSSQHILLTIALTFLPWIFFFFFVCACNNCLLCDVFDHKYPFYSFIYVYSVLSFMCIILFV